MALVHKEVAAEYLTTAKIGEKGQLTVPKEYREDLGLRAGSPVAVLRIGDGLILVPQQREFERLCKRISSRLAGAGITEEELLATLPEARDRVYARLYGSPANKKTDRGDNRRSRKR
jgi:AbrB family looped-hinge helix DNA binding protein